MVDVRGDGPSRPLRKRDLCRSALRAAAVLGIGLSAVLVGGQEIDLLIAPGKLSRVHARLAGVANCRLCHTERKKADPAKCLACHRDLGERIKAGRGWHRNKAGECITCHPEHQGEDFPLIEWDVKKFAHDETGFPLTGAHKKVADCAACHATANALPGRKGKTYLLKETGCAACHADPHGGQLGRRCAACHSPERPFRQAVVDHDKSRFPLLGAHRRLACAACHPNKRWRGIASSRCSDCHADPHRPSFGKDCRACHQEASWKTSRFDHDRTRFPLRGKHAALACARCHPPGAKAGKIPFARCGDCHRRDPHQGQFPGDCRDCHVVDGFAKVTFDHGQTRFPLTGRHSGVSCRKCHAQRGGEKAAAYRPPSMACSDCHADIHLGQFAARCDACHTTRGFGAATLTFNHQADSRFPLTGRHAALACGKCHRRTLRTFPAGKGEAVLYKPLAAECLGCHDDYHQGQLGGECLRCHSRDSFRPAPGFDHERTRFSLRLFHERVACRECHPPARPGAGETAAPTVRYKGISSDCRECHRAFDHSRAAFALTGAHAGLDCRECHNAATPNVAKPGAVKKGEWECTLCHRSPHLGITKGCRRCHSGSTWKVEQW